MVGGYSRKCPECGSEMVHIPEEKTFSGIVPGYYHCNKCGFHEED